MKIYTKRGDEGQTDLFGAGRVSKNDPRVEVYGTVDEANAWLGVALSELGADSAMTNVMIRLQNELFCLGSELAAPGALDKIPAIADADIERMEQEIDAADLELPKLKHFVLPSGSKACAALHVARTVVRRAERLSVPLLVDEQIRPIVVRYLNRLSDHLFTMARLANHRANVAEVEWLGRSKLE